MERTEHHGGHEVLHPDCPYCRYVRAARPYGGGYRSARGALPATRSARNHFRRREAVMAYALATLAALLVLSAVGGVLGFTYLRDDGAKASFSTRFQAGKEGGTATVGGKRVESASRLSAEDEGIIRYLAVEYAAGKGYPGLSVLELSSNGIAATVTLADASGGGSFVVEVVRGGRTHEWLCVDFRPAP